MRDRHPTDARRQSELTIDEEETPIALTFDTAAPYAMAASQEKPSARTSLSTLVSNLPDGCHFGQLPQDDADAPPQRVIWVEFPPNSPDNPFYFHRGRKAGITFVAIFFTLMAAYASSAFPISAPSMVAELGTSEQNVSAGVALYAFGFGLFPLFLAPISEEFGRKWTYIFSVFCFCLFHLLGGLAKNTATVLVGRFLLGGAGSMGATLVGGTISDIFIPSQRGVPMAMFSFCAVFGTGLGATTMVFAEIHLGWRWVWWIQMIVIGALLPLMILFMKETRSSVLLTRRARALRKERGLSDGAPYMSQAETEKETFLRAMLHSCSRPLVFLAREPTVMFFSAWIALGWGVFYTQIAGIPYIYKHVYGFGPVGVGMVYWAICLGAVLGMAMNTWTEVMYRRHAPTKGVEARLYGAMAGGVLFAAGCFICGLTCLPTVHWIAPCIGIVLILTAVMGIYITAFTYLAECYGIYASSAIAAQSFCRNMAGGAFSFITKPMFARLSVRWSLVLCGGLASLLALVPFVAFVWGPAIRARSPYSRRLMAMERDRQATEKAEREARGMDATGVEDPDAVFEDNVGKV
ncbi:hypothetical protein CspeluHIS016_0210750 [Cutaneotrichosporon spelunceum]|uniref:Major facilitator superfamily (MFS) profile domain-containing protein n=1 Tax=Cutaneotrichosporon spelunceum TaxID=1672016 RepID=A0AAD3YBP9_9TREE|nr:hypothetical protein CspeluHIS016_0210750 [Cutaneotrichosporon spelunceum]